MSGVSNSKDPLGRKRCCGAVILGSIAIILVITGGTIFGITRRKENKFAQSICLVLDAKVDSRTCKRSHTEDLYLHLTDPEKTNSVSVTNIKASGSCYLPVWFVEFNNTRITINDFQARVSIEGPSQARFTAAQKELEKYPINSTHKCYYDKTPGKNSVQWKKPNSTPGLVCLLVGVGLTVLTIPLCIIFAIIKSRK